MNEKKDKKSKKPECVSKNWKSSQGIRLLAMVLAIVSGFFVAVTGVITVTLGMTSDLQYSLFFQYALKVLNVFLTGSHIAPLRHIVHRNQVHMAKHPPQPRRQFHGMGRSVVYIVDQSIFKRHPARGFLRISCHSPQGSVHAPPGVHRHGAGADFIIGRVQGKRQRHRQILLHQIVNTIHQPTSRND